MSQHTLDEALDAAIAHHRAGRTTQSESICRQILEFNPNHAGALNLLGVTAQEAGRTELAGELIGRAAAVSPNDARYQVNLAVVLRSQGWLEEAVARYNRALEIDPTNADVRNSLGTALLSLNRTDDAIGCFRAALTLQSGNVGFLNNLGGALQAQSRYAEAVTCFERALATQPRSATTLSNLGAVLQNHGRFEEAVARLRQALHIDPSLPNAHANLGGVYLSMGCTNEAIACYRRALALHPDATSHSNLLLTLHYHPTCSQRAIFEEHRRWNDQHAGPLASSIRPHDNDRNPDRRLRIGYVSPDFREHAVARNFLPLLRFHDHRAFEVFCYANVARPDSLSERMRALADNWRDIKPLRDDHAAGLIRQDQIDILVDLAGHTADNRLLVFARKPAPVQVTHQGYPDTTGLETIDFRFTDAWADPPGQTEAFHSEELVRLPQCAWVFGPAEDSPPVAAPEMRPVTFGSFNTLAKVTDPMLRLWARLLATVPNSQLLLKSTALNSEATRARIKQALDSAGVAVDRMVGIMDRTATYAEHLSLYGRMDVALDTFPYHGTATTCEALWMGVPVVTLAGTTHVSRVGVSLLTNVGLPELVAHTEDQYIAIAARLAADHGRRAKLRRGLREMMNSSCLLDGPGYARRVEVVYRQMWRSWCAD